VYALPLSHTPPSSLFRFDSGALGSVLWCGRWDTLTVDAKVVEVIDGFTDIITAVLASPGGAQRVSLPALLVAPWAMMGHRLFSF